MWTFKHQHKADDIAFYVDIIQISQLLRQTEEFS